jgi:hypothetical protein
MGSRVSRVGRNGLIVVIVLWMMTELRDYVKYRKYKLANRVTSYLPFDLDFLARRMVDFYKPFEVLEIERQKHAKESGIMMSNILGRKAYFIFHPEIIKHTLSINWKNYDKGKRFIGAFKPLLGEGIFNSNGDQWYILRSFPLLPLFFLSLSFFINVSFFSLSSLPFFAGTITAQWLDHTLPKSS